MQKGESTEMGGKQSSVMRMNVITILLLQWSCQKQRGKKCDQKLKETSSGSLSQELLHLLIP